MISIQNVSFDYHAPRHFKNQPSLFHTLSLNIPAGITFIMGPNGCGKTSFFKLLLGQLHPSKGTILINNTAITALSKIELAKQITWIPAELPTAFNYTVLDIIKMGVYPWIKTGTSWAECHDQIQEALTLTGLSDMQNHPYPTLSTGMKFRVQLARAIAQKPTVLLCDETLAHLDLHYRAHIIECLKRYVNTHNTHVLITTHTLPDLETTSSATGLLFTASEIQQGPLNEVFSKEKINAAFRLSKHGSHTF